MDQTETSNEPPDSLQHTAEVLSSDLNAKFAEFIGALCNKNVSFWNCVRVSGQLDFQIDDDQFITIKISEIVVLAATPHGTPEGCETHSGTTLNEVGCSLEENAFVPPSQNEWSDIRAAEESQEESSGVKSEDSVGNEEEIKEQAASCTRQLRARNVKCHGCGKTYRNRKMMGNHRCACKDGSNFTCNICNKTFTALSTLYHHKRGLHESTKPYRCNICPKSFSFHHSLKLHVLKHEGKRPYKCNMCAKSYLTSNHLKSHLVAIHGEVRPYQCSVCQKSFPYENSLRSHVLLHSGEKPHLCTTCGKSFTSATALRNHELMHKEQTEMFECDVCSKKYRSQLLLRAHSRRHTNAATRFVCDICGHTFMYKSNLDAHYAVHGEERKFKCNVCDKSFKTSATLHSHYLVHRADAPFTCKHCSKSFKSKDRLIAHEKRHSGDKPYQCDLCGHCFPDKGGLTKHRKTVHSSVKKFACPICNKTCSRADNLRTHMKTHNDPSLLKLSYKELMVKDSSMGENEQATSAAYISGEYQPTYMLSQQVNEQVQAVANVANALASDISDVPLQPSFPKQVTFIEGGATTDGTIPLLLQVSQDYSNAAL